MFLFSRALLVSAFVFFFVFVRISARNNAKACKNSKKQARAVQKAAERCVQQKSEKRRAERTRNHATCARHAKKHGTSCSTHTRMCFCKFFSLLLYRCVFPSEKRRAAHRKQNTHTRSLPSLCGVCSVYVFVFLFIFLLVSAAKHAK